VSTSQAAQKDYSQLMLRMYLDSAQQWKETYERTASQRKPSLAAEGRAAAEMTYRNTQNMGLQVMRRIVENQVVRWRFLEHRLSSYKALPEALLKCKSPLDLFPLQASFVKQAIDDYTQETARMFQFFMPWAMAIPACR
jgi:hypothetical protein